MSPSNTPKVLIFCTGYAQSIDLWQRRYRVWLDAILGSDLSYDQILIVDDASPVLPNWPDLVVAGETTPIRPDAKIVMFRFDSHLGRPRHGYFAGWLRSFFFAISHAQRFGFTKIIHIESDAFLITPRIQTYANSVTEGWIALWCPRYSMPESGIQIIAGTAIERCAIFGRRSFDIPNPDVIEKTLPFTHAERSFIGDRYGEYREDIPRDADYVMQVMASRYADPEYLWWLPLGQNPRSAAAGRPPVPASPPAHALGRAHRGPDYRRLMRAMDQVLAPSSYFEIGTNEGASVAEMTCDAVCVDPRLTVGMNVARSRRRTFLFRCTSDEFFYDSHLRQFFPGGVDISFLDGLHHYEVLLRDFMNTERESHSRSIILLHDCLPTNTRMAERVPRDDPAEDPATRNFWTGDVWRLLPIFKKYRPDLTIHFLNCPPTGLVAISNLNPKSDLLRHNYRAIVAEFADLGLAALGFDVLWELYPMIDSAQLLADPGKIEALFSLR